LANDEVSAEHLIEPGPFNPNQSKTITLTS